MCRKVLITLGILCFLSSARAKADDVGYAYCPLGEGYVFLYDSLTSFQVLANLKCGEKVTVVDPRDNDRARVRTANGIEGYVQKSSLIAALPGTKRQPAATPDAGSQPPQAPVQPKPQAQVTKPQSQPQTEPPSQPEPEALPLPQTPQAKPQPQAELEAKAEPLVQPEPPVQGQAPVQSQAPAQSQPPPQLPPPAAVAFTPFSTLGYEQNVPRMEAFGGFSFLNAGTNGLANRQNVAGFEGSVAVHVNRWLAGEGSIGGYYKTIQITNVGTFGFHDYTMMGGPRFNIGKAFFHGLVGIDHLTGSANFYQVGASSSDNALAGAFGGGVQWNVSRQFAVRTSADYLLSRLGGLTQSNFRVTMGIVFQAGSLNGER
jgi:hypothetical protein